MLLTCLEGPFIDITIFVVINTLALYQVVVEFPLVARILRPKLQSTVSFLLIVIEQPFIGVSVTVSELAFPVKFIVQKSAYVFAPIEPILTLSILFIIYEGSHIDAISIDERPFSVHHSFFEPSLIGFLHLQILQCPEAMEFIRHEITRILVFIPIFKLSVPIFDSIVERAFIDVSFFFGSKCANFELIIIELSLEGVTIGIDEGVFATSAVLSPVFHASNIDGVVFIIHSAFHELLLVECTIIFPNIIGPSASTIWDSRYQFTVICEAILIGKDTMGGSSISKLSFEDAAIFKRALTLPMSYSQIVGFPLIEGFAAGLICFRYALRWPHANQCVDINEANQSSSEELESEESFLFSKVSESQG